MVYKHIYGFVFVVDVSFKGKNSIKMSKMSVPEYKDFLLEKLHYWKFSVLSNYFHCVDNENANISFKCSKWVADEAYNYSKNSQGHHNS